jgi:hypothetical protein
MTGQDFDELGTDATNVINSKNYFLQNYRQKLLRNHVIVSNIGI